MSKILPPDPDGMNDARAEWAGAALRHFQCATGTDYEDVLGDLLCDLIHWSDRNNFDFEAALFRARGHYQAETDGEEAEDLLGALQQAVQALNVVPRFPVPDLLTDSYRIAAICDRAIRKAKGGEP